MRWLFENPQLLIVIGGAIAYWLNERRKAKEKQAMAEEAEREPTDDEMAERTRRIQEEIRRKIEERQGRTAPPVQTRPTAVPPPIPLAPPPLREVVAVDEAPGAAELERVMEQQRRYAEQLERLVAAERAAAAAAVSGTSMVTMAAYASTAATSATKPLRGDDGVRSSLNDRAALRRAIVLREVLGAPKALQ